jgi:hypothetical protein
MLTENGALDGLERIVPVWKRQSKFANWIAGLNGQRGPSVGLDCQVVLAQNSWILAGTAGN